MYLHDFGMNFETVFHIPHICDVLGSKKEAVCCLHMRTRRNTIEMNRKKKTPEGGEALLKIFVLSCISRQKTAKHLS